MIEYLRYQVAPEQGAAFEAAYRRAAGPLLSSPYCDDFTMSRCEEDPTNYILRIEWTSTSDHLEKFRGSPEFQAFFAEIREYVPAIQEMRHYQPINVAEVPTLYEWAGGQQALEKLFTEFYARVARDEILAPVFAGMNPDHPKHVAIWLAEVFGGPTTYSEQHGGHRHMISRHLGRELTERHRRHWVNLLIDTADAVGLPSDPEFRSAFVGYLEWGTRMALMLSQPGIELPEQAPMPTWGWGEVRRPYRP